MNKHLKYLRISLVSQCNLRCYYCYPGNPDNFDKKDNNYDKLKTAINLFCRLGVDKIRFTGGEPALYKKLPDLIASAKEFKKNIITCMTSNGVRLENLAPRLSNAGLDSVNISLDTLDKNKFHELTKRDWHDKVIKGIEQSRKYIPIVKLNTVLINGFNIDEVVPLIEFADKLRIDIRFIEYMPNKFNASKSREFISGGNVIQSLPFELTPLDTDKTSAAKYYRSNRHKIRIGFISPVSHSFCASCNRMRLSSDGYLYNCLFSSKRIDLFRLLDKENPEKYINKLISQKTFNGCSIENSQLSYPSFNNIGG